MMKPFASLVSLALALTPIVMIAVSAAQSQTPAAQPEVALPSVVSQEADRTAEACRKVRVIAIGYGEPAGPRCETPRG